MWFLLSDQKLSVIKQVELEASWLENVVSLAQWIPWFNVPKDIVDSMIDKINKWFTNRYSIVPGILELREQIALQYLKKYNININYENEVIITAWAIQAISTALLTLVENNKNEIILIDPSYASYQTAVKVARWTIVNSKLDENLDLDIEDIKSKITPKTKAILLCNPNNPTWSIFSYKKIEELVELWVKHDFYVILDEVYDEFIYENNTFCSAAKLFEKYSSNLIIINSWSKIYGMTWWRIWFMISNSQLFHEFLKVHDSLVTCAPVHSQWAALASFQINDDWFTKIQKELKERRDFTINKLSQISEFVEFNIPQATYYIFPKFKYTNDDIQECIKILKEVWLALVPWSGFGSRGTWHFRICFWRDLNDLEEWLNRLIDYYKK